MLANSYNETTRNTTISKVDKKLKLAAKAGLFSRPKPLKAFNLTKRSAEFTNAMTRRSGLHKVGDVVQGKWERESRRAKQGWGNIIMATAKQVVALSFSWCGKKPIHGVYAPLDKLVKNPEKNRQRQR